MRETGRVCSASHVASSRRMRISCPSCSAAYHVSDDRIAGREATAKCRKCGAGIPLAAIGLTQHRAEEALPAASRKSSQSTQSEEKVSARKVAGGEERLLERLSPASLHGHSGMSSSRISSQLRRGELSAGSHPLPSRAKVGPLLTGSRLPSAPLRPLGGGIRPPTAVRQGSISKLASASRVASLAPRPSAIRGGSRLDGSSFRRSEAGEAGAGTVRTSSVWMKPERSVGASAGAEQAPKDPSAVNGRRIGKGLAGAFSNALARSPTLELSPASSVEWFVALDDSPQGPFSIVALQDKIREGVLTVETLVWRDGLSDWVPAGTVDTVAALLECNVDRNFSASAFGSHQRSAPNAPAGDRTQPKAIGALQRSTSAESDVCHTDKILRRIDQKPETIPASSSLSDATVLSSAGADSHSSPHNSGVDLGRAFGPSPRQTAAHAESSATTRTAPQEVEADSAVDEEVHELEIPGLKRRRNRTSAKGPFVAIAAAMVLGLTLGYVVFSKDATNSTADNVPRSLSAAIVDTPNAEQTPSPDGNEDSQPGAIVLAEPTVVTVGVGSSAVTANPSRKAAENGPVQPAPSGMSGLRGLTGVQSRGPAAVNTASRGSGADSESLDASAIQRTVGRYKTGVKRSCWEPAISSRTPNSPNSARVQVTVNISADGSVSSVSTTGDPSGYRGLARCIEARVRGWRFPRSSGSTTTQIPFVFASQ